MSSNFVIWWNVPNKSEIKLWVADNGSDILAQSRVLRSDETQRTIRHIELVPGKATEVVNEDRSYSIRSAVVFQGTTDQRATIHAEVIDANGNVIPDSNGDTMYAYRVRGKAGDKPVRATLVVVNQNA